MKQLDPYDNSLLFVKYIMTFIVIINHCLTHYSVSTNNIGIATVPIFFFISGFTSYLSLEKKGHSKKYFKRRIIRIFPELWFTTIVGSIVIALQYPDVLKEISFYVFNITQATFLQFWTPKCLQMYGCGVPNGALWTICVTLQFYILLYYFYPIMKKTTIKKDVMLLILFIVINPCFSYLQYCLPEILYKLVCQSIIPFIYMFYFGMLMCKYFNNLIRFVTKYFFLFLIIYVIIYCFRGYTNVMPHVYLTQGPINCIIDFIFWFSFAFKFCNIKCPVDIQYGIYLNHMIAVNFFLHNDILVENSVLRIALTIVVTVIFAIISKMITISYRNRNNSIDIIKQDK